MHRFRHRPPRPGSLKALLPVLALVLALSIAGRARCASPRPDRAVVHDSDTVVLTARDIKKLGVRSVQEMLNTVPGVKASDSYVAIRGSYKVRVLLDGLTLNDSGTLAIKLGLVPFRDLARVEIHKGGGGVAFGNDASGGAIVFTTKRLSRTSAFLEAAAGSQGKRRARFNLSRSSGNLGLGVSGDYCRSTGYRPNNDKEEKRFRAKVSYRPTWWGKGRAPVLAIDYGRITQGFAGYPEYPTPHSRGDDQSLGLSFTWKRWGVDSGTYFTRFEQIRTDSSLGTHTMLRTSTLKQDLRKGWSLGRLGALSTGLSLESTHGEGSGLAPRCENAMGIFASKKFRLASWPLWLALGLRANLYSAFDNVVNPSAELALRLGVHRFKLAFSRSNNLPSLRQRFFSYSSMKANPALGMEQAVNLSLGVASQWTRRVSGGLTLFNRDISDRITYVRLGGGVGQYRNFGETRLRGVDAHLCLRPQAWLQLRTAYTYLEALDLKTGLWLSGKPRHKVKLDLLLK